METSQKREVGRWGQEWYLGKKMVGIRKAIEAGMWEREKEEGKSKITVRVDSPEAMK